MTASLFVLWVHVTAIAVWVGGLFSLLVVSVPVLRGAAGSPPEAARLAALMLRRFQKIGWEVLLLILLTGLWNLLSAGAARGFAFSASYVGALSLKFGLFLAIVLLQLWQRVRLVPALESLSEAASPEAVRKLYRGFLWTSVLGLGLAVAAVFLGLGLRYR